MDPARADFVVDLTYGVLIFIAVGLIVQVGSDVGVAFGIGVLVSYIVHIGWKMSRFDPDWMTREVAEQVEETVSEGVRDTVSEEIEEAMGEDGHADPDS
jgi:O-antigen ligase